MPSGNPYIEATGGQVIRYGDWVVHEFYGSDIFDVTQAGSGAFGDVEYFGEAGGRGRSYPIRGQMRQVQIQIHPLRRCL